MRRTNPTKKLVLSGLFLALALLLPMLIGQIPEIGSLLSPMHIPVYLCGFVCGPFWGAAVGLIAPLLKMALFQVPALPMATAMAFELCFYGLVSGLVYPRLPRQPISLYISLLLAMVSGRIAFGLAMLAVMGLQGTTYTMTMFLTSALFGAIPGIIAHFIIVPVVMLAIEHTQRRY